MQESETEQPMHEASHLTPAQIFNTIFQEPQQITRDIKKLVVGLERIQEAYLRLYTNPDFKLFLDTTINKIGKEHIANPIYREGMVHPALAHMTASELALIYQGMSLAVSQIYKDIEVYTSQVIPKQEE